MEDQQIIALYFQRQEQAIQETDRKYGRLCHGIAVNVLSDRQDSEECVNDTYLAVWHQIPPTRLMSFRAFLCGITRNLALKKLEWRQAAKRRCPGTVSLEELENLLPDERFAPGCLRRGDRGVHQRISGPGAEGGPAGLSTALLVF